MQVVGTRNRFGAEDAPDGASTALSLDISRVQRWSTADVPQPQRADYFAAALSEAAVPFGVDGVDPGTFHAEVSFTSLDAIGICSTAGAAHRSFRATRELASTSDHCFYLLVLHQAHWTTKHRGDYHMKPGDVLVHDTRYPFENDVLESFNAVGVAMKEDWLRRWFTNTDALGGTRIARATPWGKALSSYLAGLSPELVARAPLPAAVLADQVGGLLSLAVTSLRAPESQDARPAARQLHERIHECILQRCTEPQLTATEVAVSLGISLRTLHRSLSATETTFGASLIEARASVAERMLHAPLFERLTTAEIGRRAGFLSSSHFARVMRDRTGLTPRQLRRSGLRSGTRRRRPTDEVDPSA